MASTSEAGQQYRSEPVTQAHLPAFHYRQARDDFILQETNTGSGLKAASHFGAYGTLCWLRAWCCRLRTLLREECQEGVNVSVVPWRALDESRDVMDLTRVRASFGKMPQVVEVTSGDGVRLGVIDGLGALIDRDGKCSIDDQVDQSTSPTNTRNSLTQSAPLSKISTSVELELLRTLAVSLVLDRKDKYFLQYAPTSFLADFVASCVAASHFPHLVLTDFLSWYEWNKHLLIRGHTLHDIFGPIELLPSSDEPEAKATVIALLQRLTNNSGIEYSMSEMALDPHRREETQAVVDFEAYLPRVHDTILKMNRRLMVTNEGHIGMAPSRGFKGDVVAILFGCSVPVLLRPRDQNVTSYAFIGECYVHDFMNGEAIQELNSGTRRKETFALQ